MRFGSLSVDVRGFPAKMAKTAVAVKAATPKAVAAGTLVLASAPRLEREAPVREGRHEGSTGRESCDRPDPHQGGRGGAVTWVVWAGGRRLGILDLPVSVAAMVCETAGCDWGALDPHGQPGHLAALVAGVRSFVGNTGFDAELLEVAAEPLAKVLEALEVDGGPD